MIGNDDALRAMRDYAADQNSYSLVVVHNGVVQTEWYAEGWDGTRLAQSQSMHKSVLPVLIGAAIGDGAIGSAEDALGVYIEEWADDPRGRITLAEMMMMTSGLGVDIVTVWQPCGVKLPEPSASSKPLGRSLSALSISSISTTRPLSGSMP